MTKKQFTDYKYRSFEEVHIDTDIGLVSGMIIGIDFMEWKFHVRPFPITGFHAEDVWVGYQLVNKPGGKKPVNEPLFKVLKSDSGPNGPAAKGKP